MKAFLFDSSVCNGCYCCQIACKDEHVDNDWSPYAYPQPDTGQFWLKLEEFVRGTVPKVKVNYRPIMCQHCENPSCVDACKEDQAILRREDGLVIINPKKCSGCGKCLEACPYGVIYFNDQLNIAQKCTGCAHLIDNGWIEPRCVDVCPNKALKYIDEEEIKRIDGVEKALPQNGNGPRMYYLNLPKKFISGTVYDPIEKLVIKKATCILTNKGNGLERRAETDGFGDFWFNNLDIEDYQLIIKANGFKKESISQINTQLDVNLGDIPLSKI